jgi:DTW domain-containing protein YfiP
MSRHSKPHLRCRDCRMHLSLCICALLPRIETRTRVVLIIHQLESLKPTNTGVVAARCLPNSAIVYRGRPPEGVTGASMTADVPTLSAVGAQRLMLFPHATATPLEDWRGRTEPIALLVPDGTWRQAGRTRTQLGAQLGDIPCVSLPAAPAQKRLRNAFSSQRLATLEAIALALGILEGPDVERELLRVYRIMTDRTLWSNGRVTADEVTGGIPPGVRSHDPLSTGR